MRLAIVGSRALSDEELAMGTVRELINHYQEAHGDLTIISGGARGIDSMAAMEAHRRGLNLIELLPRVNNWAGYAERNLRIAAECDELVAVVDRASKTYGSRWTRDRAEGLGKRAVIIWV